MVNKAIHIIDKLVRGLHGPDFSGPGPAQLAWKHSRPGTARSKSINFKRQRLGFKIVIALRLAQKQEPLKLFNEIF